MGGGLRIGRIAGIEIALDWSLAIIFLLVAFGLGAGVLPTWHPHWGAALTWVVALAAAALFIVSVLLHELSHALVGRAQGIKVPRITLFVFGGMAQMEREAHAWRPELLMAAVGPLTSFALGVGCLFAGRLLHGGALHVDPADPLAAMAQVGPLATILFWLGPINILLGLFNLVPGFPLDGGRVLRAALWGITGDVFRATRWAAGMGQLVAWLLIASGFAMILGLRVPVFGSGLLGGVWIALIGWFLNNAAQASYRQLLAEHALGGVPVSRVMVSSFATVQSGASVATLIEEHLLASDQRSYPVLGDDGRLAGMVTLEDVRKVPPEARAGRTVAEIMTPARELATIAPGAPASDALRALAASPQQQLPVVADGRLQGLLRREDIVKWLTLKGAP